MSEFQADFSKTSEEILTSMINHANPARNFTPVRLKFGAPKPLPTDQYPDREADTEIAVTVDDDRTFPVFLKRKPFPDVVGSAVAIEVGDAANTHDLIAKINEAANIQLSTNDVVNIPVSDTAKAAKGMMLAARPESLLWRGSMNLVFTDAATVPQPPALTGISVAPATVALVVGDKATLTATAVPSGASLAGLTWSSDSADVTFVAGANGTVEITAVNANDAVEVSAKIGNITGSALVDVAAAPAGDGE